MPKSREVPRNLLVARFSALGDVAMTIPVLYSVCENNPLTRFIFVTRESQTGMFVNPPDNLVVLGLDLKGKHRRLRDLWKLIKDLKAEYAIDGFADLHGVIRTHWMALACRMVGIPTCTIRKGRSHKRALTRRHNKILLPLTSSRMRYREVFLRFGMDVTQRFESIYGTGKSGVAVFADITPPKSQEEKWIGIAPFAKHRGKIYPLEQMEKVVETLAHRHDTKIFLFGGGDEENKVLARWAATYPSTINLASERHGFAKELALTSHLDLMVSMDSANMHLASLVGTRVISVWGATHPYCGFKGFRQKDSDMVQLPMTCRPCSVFGNKKCISGDYNCLAAIPPSMILNKIYDIIKERK